MPHPILNQIIHEIGRSVLGKESQIRQALCCLIAGGHLLIEDLPGMGKTTLAHALAQVLGLRFGRVQFTSDLLPGDILGVSIYDSQTRGFLFKEGPVFTEVLLADELNRATPKTQSALLEAMAEGQVTIDGVTRPLPPAFFVIATQNPQSQSGTYALPESQLDRFLMRIDLGYPDHQAERQILLGQRQQSPLALRSLLDVARLGELRRAVNQVGVAEGVLDYLQRLIHYTRTAAEFHVGLSTRGGLALLQASRAWALLDGRHYVMPDDIQAVCPAVVAHRLAVTDLRDDGRAHVQKMLAKVEVVA